LPPTSSNLSSRIARLRQRFQDIGFLCSGAKVNLALGSINLRINHAEVTRSTPGRGRVTHTRFQYSASETLSISAIPDFVLEVCMAFNARSTCSRSGLPKKSTETVRIMNNFCHHRYLLVANLKTLSSVSKVQSSPRCPNPPSYMSNGTALKFGRKEGFGIAFCRRYLRCDRCCVGGRHLQGWLTGGCR
jgi:hypothetical protein